MVKKKERTIQLRLITARAHFLITVVPNEVAVARTSFRIGIVALVVIVVTFASRRAGREFSPQIVVVAVVVFLRRRFCVVNQRSEVAFSRRIVQRGVAGQSRSFVVVFRRRPQCFFLKRRPRFRQAKIVVTVVLRTSIRRRFPANALLSSPN